MYYSAKVFYSCLLINVLLLGSNCVSVAQTTGLSENRIALIPYPKDLRLKSDSFLLDNTIKIVLDKAATTNDLFAANELLKYLEEVHHVKASIAGKQISGKIIYLSRKASFATLGVEGYSIHSDGQRVVVKAGDEAGLFYAVQTIMQLIQKKQSSSIIPGVDLVDRPDTKIRAVHYDTKHHQDNSEFVKSFIRDLARYKINMLIWEWEDKFEYPSHPEIGAPGAFTMKEMQEFTHYAKQFHIQIVPLVQGLGHVSFILKWPQYAHLRELPASNFEFCPLKDGSYKLLFDLWQDAIKATPGSEYVHIGSDETYELGKCADCKKKEDEIGRSGLYHLFVGKGAAFIQKTGRNAMAWEAPMGWAKGRLQVYDKDMKQEQPVVPQKDLVLTESYDYETPDLKYAKQAKSLGYPVFAYDPNPGIEQLFLPYFFSKDGKGDTVKGSLESSFDFLKATMGKNVFDGVIRTSWDDSGLPMQAWMLCFATTAAYSWNAAAPSLPEFTTAFFKNRYGNNATGIDILYRLLNEGAYFYMESFERRVWAWGEIGKTHLPDLPRGDALEYDPFWNSQYADRVKAANIFLAKMDTAINICETNLKAGVANRYDIEVFMSLASLTRHTALTYLDLSQLEDAIKQAHEYRFTDLDASYKNLQKAAQIVTDQLSRRDKVFNELVQVWNKTRLEKGMSTKDKPYFFEQDRTRHFANRVPGMSYLIVDEQQLGLENYLVKLQQYIQYFGQRFLPAKVNN
jgi:hexosaminidase